MPQKKTARKSAPKKRTTRKAGRKPKVYIPAYKVIIFCCVIITLCMGLLLITNLKEPDRKLSDAIAERFEEEKPEAAQKPAEKSTQKQTEKPAQKPAPAK